MRSLLAVIGLVAAPLAAQQAPVGQPRVLDAFDSVSEWRAVPSDGVSLRVARDSGVRGTAMRLDFDFHGGGGYAVAHRTLPADLPPNYELSFWIRGNAPKENVEVKLIDSTGDNVWWVNRRDYTFPERWTRYTLKKRQVSFAWGPKGGGDLTHMAAFEISVTAGSGGKGSVWIDELTLTPREVPLAHPPAPRATASASVAGSSPALAVDGNARTAWVSSATAAPWIALDLGTTREYGGLTVDWDPAHRPRDYDVETSDDGRAWTTAYALRNGAGARDEIFLPESESHFIRLRMRDAQPVALREITLRPLAFGASLDAFDFAVAKDAPRGTYPRAFTDSVQTYWTVIGAPAADREALVSEDGAVEVGKGMFSLEPFLYSDGKLTSWADVTPVQSLERGDLPIPSVQWTPRGSDPLVLTTTSWVAGPADSATLMLRYRVRNRSALAQRATLFVALRPFQVNGPFQFLNTPGGAAVVRELAYDGRTVRVMNDGEESPQSVIPVTPPSGFGASGFDAGGTMASLHAGRVPAASSASDSIGRADGALAYALDIAPNATREVIVAVPFARTPAPSALDAAAASALAARSFDRTSGEWAARVDGVRLRLPASVAWMGRTLRSMQAYILINQDGPRIQPGSRSYERSWIRDGALTSEALLRTGHAERAEAFLDWFAPFQYANGKVPCCVDQRGADPVPEHDSDGEFIYLVRQTYRFTGDRARLERMWPHVERAVAYLDSLRLSERTPVYRTGANLSFYGVLPPSISHEGYSAKPMHSYWDDFWALVGFRDAATVATALGKRLEADRYSAIAMQFEGDLRASIATSMRQHGINYVPGAADLGDFDPTSTTIGLEPGGELGRLPDDAVQATFGRYWRESQARAAGSRAWKDYTPYELRTVGAFVRLGQPERAHAMLDFFHRSGQRPAAWNQWAEVVRNGYRTPGFIGDMPHTWVGSDFIRSFLDLFAYERVRDSALVLGAGIPDRWARDTSGVAIAGIRTPYGPLELSERGTSGATRITVGGGGRVPPGGFVVRAPFPRRPRRAIVNGAATPLASDGSVTVRTLPATIDFSY